MFLILLSSSILIPLLFVAILLRRVVPTNEVHIVQSSGGTTSYGKDSVDGVGRKTGNTYYEWPSWLPVIGITKVSLPTSVFDIDLEDYEAYDKGRLPFAVDVKAFFKISDSNTAARAVANFDELKNQLTAVVQGAIRVVLGSSDIEEIMQGRSGLGDAFTREVNEQLKEWGVMTVKNIELMDLRDGTNGKAIHNIMEKKKSHIESESRIEVAKNQRAAQIAEVEAKQQVELRQQEANQLTGIRTVEAQQAVLMADQKSAQAVKEQERLTKEKEMAVIQVQAVRSAEINKAAAIVKAEQERQQIEIAAAAKLEQQKKNAEGIEAEGRATGEADKAKLMAPVAAQLELAEKIGANEGYQSYLVSIEKVKAAQAVGIKQAEALQDANIKVIANSGSVTDGIGSIGEMFTAKGGTQFGAMLEGFINTPAGRTAMEKLGISTEHNDTRPTVQ